MKAYKFRLQSYLNFTERQRDECFAELKKIRDQIADLLSQNQMSEGIIRNGMSFQKTNVHQLQAFYAYTDSLQLSMKENLRKVEEFRRIENEQLEELKSIRNRINVIEKLKEKSFETYTHEIKLEEQKFLDELGIRGYKRT